VLLAFHPSQIVSDSGSGSKLPLTVYESIFEGDNIADTITTTQISDDRQPLHIRFRELPYSIETGEAEMISVDFVARGAGNAMAIESSTESGKPTKAAATGTRETKGSKQDAGDAKKEDDSIVLSPENEECKLRLLVSLDKP
jgi:COP9 signalosome complex subunit 6